MKSLLERVKKSSLYRAASILRDECKRLLRPKHNDAYKYCHGSGLEVGALSLPYRFGLTTRVAYADVLSADAMRCLIDSLPIHGLYAGNLVKPSYILNPPRYSLSEIDDQALDFVYSSHSLEHSPNFLYAISEYIRVVKCGTGVVYTVIPNRNFTYDRERLVTPPERLIERYEKGIFSYSLEDAIDVVDNTINHPAYSRGDLAMARRIISDNDGSHHFFVYDQSNIVPLLDYVQKSFGANLLYFRAEGVDLHFCLQRN
jgi:hypothetical protein